MAYVNIAGYNDYQIAVDYPHQIRRISTDRVVSEHTDRDGYIRLNLVVNNEQQHCHKHVIVARAFVPNDDPINKTHVDHINHDRRDYHISNLRWCTPSENALNKSSHRGVGYQFAESLPEDSVRVHAFRQHTLRECIYYSLSTNQFYLKCGQYAYRIMHQNVRCRKTFVLARSVDNKQVRLYNDEVAANIDMYMPIDVEDEIDLN